MFSLFAYASHKDKLNNLNERQCRGWSTKYAKAPQNVVLQIRQKVGRIGKTNISGVLVPVPF